MTLNHSLETHKNLIARIPSVTGRDLVEWFKSLESGPAFGGKVIHGEGSAFVTWVS